jgi:hypothetical protein
MRKSRSSSARLCIEEGAPVFLLRGVARWRLGAWRYSGLEGPYLLLLWNHMLWLFSTIGFCVDLWSCLEVSREPILSEIPRLATAVAFILTHYCALSMKQSQATTSNIPRTCFMIGSGTSTHRSQIQIVIMDSVVDSRYLCYLTL